MSMKERKLFFTRNGQYSPWEMLAILPGEFLRDLYTFLLQKMWVDTAPGLIDEYPSFLYRVYRALTPEQQEQFLQEIQKRFYLIEKPKSDFNGLIYYYAATSLDLKSAELNLQELKNNVNELEIDGLQIDYFIYPNINGINNVIDIRFTTEKSSFYMENENKQLLNTEVRIYLDLNIVLLTNFSSYTHTDKEKNLFITEVLRRVSSHRGKIEPIKFSDQSLRNLLLMDEKHLPSKFKLDIDGRIKIGIEITQPEGLITTVSEQDEIKQFYHKYPISLLKVKISDGEEDKYLNLDGPAGKIISRSQNFDVSDIDNFIKKLGIILQFDYLNHTQEPEIKAQARRQITATNSRKDNIVSACFKEVEKEIKKHIIDDTNVSVKIIKNAFFFCIREKIFLNGGELKYTLDSTTTAWLAKISEKTSSEINALFSHLIAVSLGIIDFEKLMVTLDSEINNSGMISNASGL